MCWFSIVFVLYGYCHITKVYQVCEKSLKNVFFFFLYPTRGQASVISQSFMICEVYDLQSIPLMMFTYVTFR